MHEVGLMQQAVEIALKHGSAGGAERITRVRMKVGALSGVEPNALQFAFEVVTRGTMAQNATLDIDAESGFDLRVASIEVE